MHRSGASVVNLELGKEVKWWVKLNTVLYVYRSLSKLNPCAAEETVSSEFQTKQNATQNDKIVYHRCSSNILSF